MNRLLAWFQLEGETPGERIRQNPGKLAVFVLVVLVGSLVVYGTLSLFMGEVLVTIVMILGAVAVGLHLRRLLVPPQPAPASADGDD